MVAIFYPLMLKGTPSPTTPHHCDVKVDKQRLFLLSLSRINLKVVRKTSYPGTFCYCNERFIVSILDKTNRKQAASSLRHGDAQFKTLIIILQKKYSIGSCYIRTKNKT